MMPAQSKRKAQNRAAYVTFPLFVHTLDALDHGGSMYLFKKSIRLTRIRYIVNEHSASAKNVTSATSKTK